jgi:hypothetical protein
MLILDAGAFIAAERGDDNVAALVKRERKHGRVPLTNGGVVAQVWRGGNGKQVPIARLLASAHVIPVDNELGRRAGQLLARTGTSDAIDASVICLAQDGDDVLTSDPADLQALARAAGVHVDLISVLARTCALKGARGPVANYATGPLAVAASETDRPASAAVADGRAGLAGLDGRRGARGLPGPSLPAGPAGRERVPQPPEVGRQLPGADVFLPLLPRGPDVIGLIKRV